MHLTTPHQRHCYQPEQRDQGEQGQGKGGKVLTAFASIQIPAREPTKQGKEVVSRYLAAFLLGYCCFCYCPAMTPRTRQQ